MGNNNQKTDAPIPAQIRREQRQQDSGDSLGVLNNVIGCPKLVKSLKTEIQLQEYVVSLSPQISLAQSIQIYKLRSSSYSKNIAVVFDHALLDENDLKFRVSIEKYAARLSQLMNLNAWQALVIFYHALNGFTQILHHCKTPFYVTDQMIAINESAQVRVWANQNFAINGICPNGKLRNQNQMISSIQQTILGHLDPESEREFISYSSHISSCQRLLEGKNKLDLMIPQVNKKVVLLQILEKLKGEKQPQIITKEPIKVSNQTSSPQKKINLQSEEFIKTDQLTALPLYQRSLKTNQQNPSKKAKIMVSMNDEVIGQQKNINTSNGLFKKLKQKVVRDNFLTPSKTDHNQQLRKFMTPNHKIIQRSKSPFQTFFHKEKVQKKPLSRSDIMVNTEPSEVPQQTGQQQNPITNHQGNTSQRNKSPIKQIKKFSQTPQYMTYFPSQKMRKQNNNGHLWQLKSQNINKLNIPYNNFSRSQPPKVVISGKLVTKPQSIYTYNPDGNMKNISLNHIPSNRNMNDFSQRMGDGRQEYPRPNIFFKNQPSIEIEKQKSMRLTKGQTSDKNNSYIFLERSNIVPPKTRNSYY